MKTTFTAIAVLALSQLSLAAPATVEGEFSMEAWATSLVETPETALSVDEAIAAFTASRAAHKRCT